MTSTNDGKDVKSNQTIGHKSKSYYIELYTTESSNTNDNASPLCPKVHLTNTMVVSKDLHHSQVDETVTMIPELSTLEDSIPRLRPKPDSKKSLETEIFLSSLEKALSSDNSLEERTEHVCEAWRRVYSLYQHSAASTHPHLLSWLQRHTANTVLQSKWAKSKNEHIRLTEAIDALVAEANAASAGRPQLPWEQTLLQRAAWFRKALENPWDNPVLKSLINPESEPLTDQQVLEWLISEHGVVLVTRLQRMVGAGNCDDLALLLASAVMDRARAATPHPKDERPDEKDEKRDESSFVAVLEREASFTSDEWEMLADIELVLLLKTDKRPRCIELAKLTPLRLGYKMVERLRKRLETSPRDKKLWKHAKEVATIVTQVLIARCMVVGTCAGAGRDALYWCARSLARLVEPGLLRGVSTALAAPAATARHLHTFCAALSAECKELKTDVIMKPFICELYVRAITAGMNELEQLKLNAEKESDARLYEQTLAGWFTQLGGRLTDSVRLRAECALTAFSVHPARKHYERVAATQPPSNTTILEPKSETTSDYGSWANDSRTQSNLVKNSETLQLKQCQQHQANVLSTAILTEGEALGLETELCQDLAVLLSGPRVKTLSWDMDRDVLLEKCRAYMEKTRGGTRAVTTELKYLNLDPNAYQHLPEEEDDENDVYYGIEKGYEHEVQFEEPEEIWQNAFFDPEQTESANDSEVEGGKKKPKAGVNYSEDEEDPLSTIADAKKEKKKRAKEKDKEQKKKKTHKRDDSNESSKERRKDKDKEPNKDKKPKKERKNKSEQPATASLTSLLGMKIAKVSSPVQDGEKRVRKKKERRREPTFNYVSVPDSEYDSQGKLSLDDPNVLVDGVFSMDELKSPESASDSRKPIDNTKTTLKSTEMRKPVIKELKTRPRSSSTVTTSSDSDAARAKSPYLTPNQIAHRHVVNPSIKSSLHKLLQFRRNQNKMRAVARPAPVRTPTPTTLVGMKVYSPDEVPKVYLNKKQSKQLEALSNDINSRFTNVETDATPKTPYNEAGDNKLHSQQSLYNTQKYNPQSTPMHLAHNVLNESLKLTDYTTQNTVKVAQQTILNQSPTGVLQTNYASPTKPDLKTPWSVNLTPTKPTITYQPFHKSMQNLSTDKLDVPKKPLLINDPNYFSQQHFKASQLSPKILSNTIIKPPIQTSPVKDDLSQIYSNTHRTYSCKPAQNINSQITNLKSDVIRYGQKQLSSSMQNITEMPGSSHDATRRRIPIPSDMLHGPASQAKSYNITSRTETISTTQALHSSNSTLTSQSNSFQSRDRIITPAPETENNDFDEFLLEIVKSIHAGNKGPDKNVTVALNKEVKMSYVQTSSTSKRTDLVTPQSAKQQLPQKKSENAPNTFSRLSYMHKNKQNENKFQLTDAVTLELNKKIMEHKISKAKCMKNEVTISRVGMTNPNAQEPETLFSRMDQSGTKLNKNCPLLSSMLESTKTPNFQTYPTCHNSAGNQPNREDADLLLLLRHQTILKPNLNTTQTLTSDSQQSMQYLNSQTKVETQSTTNQSLLGTKVKNIDLIDTCTVKTEADADEWKRVMDAIRAQKTEPLGPNALDLALKKNKRRQDNQTSARTSGKRVGAPTKKRETDSSKANQTTRKPSTEKHSQIPKTSRDAANIKKVSPEMFNRIDVQNKHPSSNMSKEATHVATTPNSDYDMLDDLIDDDLRRELGEISSDEELYYAQNVPLAKGKSTKNIPKSNSNVCKAANMSKEKLHSVNPKAIISQNQTNFNITGSNVKSVANTSTCNYSNMIINNSSHRGATHVENRTPAVITEMLPQYPPSTTIITNQVAQNTANNIMTHIEANQYMNNIVPTNVIIASVPQAAPVVVIRQDLVYDPYPTIRIHETQVNAELCAINQNVFAVNTAPNIAVYQTTQFAAPVINPIIIGNATTTTNVSDATAMGNEHDAPDLTKEDLNMPDEDNISLETALRLSDAISETSDPPNLDFNMNRNCERKVLSQVHENHTTDVDKESHISRLLNDDVPLKTEQDEERIKLKRQSLINRTIIHAGGHPPIALSYAPLSKKVTRKVLQQDLPKIGTIKPSLKIIPNIKNDIVKVTVQSPAPGGNNENIESTNQDSTAKENQKSCRRIWLRSSNTISIKKVSPVIRPRIPLKRKTRKPPITDNTIKNITLTNFENINKESINITKRASKRILIKNRPDTTKTSIPKERRENVVNNDEFIDFEKVLDGSIVLKSTAAMLDKSMQEPAPSEPVVEQCKQLEAIQDTEVSSQSNKAIKNKLEPMVVLEKLKNQLGDQLVIKSTSSKTSVIANNHNLTILSNKNKLEKRAVTKLSSTASNRIKVKVPASVPETAAHAVTTVPFVVDTTNKLKPMAAVDQEAIKQSTAGSSQPVQTNNDTNKLKSFVVNNSLASLDEIHELKSTILDDQKDIEQMPTFWTSLEEQKIFKEPVTTSKEILSNAVQNHSTDSPKTSLDEAHALKSTVLDDQKVFEQTSAFRKPLEEQNVVKEPATTTPEELSNTVQNHSTNSPETSVDEAHESKSTVLDDQKVTEQKLAFGTPLEEQNVIKELVTTTPERLSNTNHSTDFPETSPFEAHESKSTVLDDQKVTEQTPAFETPLEEQNVVKAPVTTSTERLSNTVPNHSKDFPETSADEAYELKSTVLDDQKVTEQTLAFGTPLEEQNVVKAPVTTSTERLSNTVPNHSKDFPETSADEAYELKSTVLDDQKVTEQTLAFGTPLEEQNVVKAPVTTSTEILSNIVPNHSTDSPETSLDKAHELKSTVLDDQNRHLFDNKQMPAFGTPLEEQKVVKELVTTTLEGLSNTIKSTDSPETREGFEHYKAQTSTMTPSLVMLKDTTPVIKSNRTVIALNAESTISRNAESKINNETDPTPSVQLPSQECPDVDMNPMSALEDDDVEIIGILEAEAPTNTGLHSNTKILKCNPLDAPASKDQPKVDTSKSLLCRKNINDIHSVKSIANENVLPENLDVNQCKARQLSNLKQSNMNHKGTEAHSNNLDGSLQTEAQSVSINNAFRKSVSCTKNKQKTATCMKGDIKFEEIPLDDPDKKLVRIWLPNGKTLNATISGKMKGDFDSLFAQPSMRAILASNAHNDIKRYTINYKQDLTNKDAQIKNFYIKQKQTVDTVNLISDDEDEVQTRIFNTEFGKYNTNVDQETIDLHQKKFHLRSEVKMLREDLFKSNRTKPKSRSMPSEKSSLLTRNKSKLLSVASITTNNIPKDESDSNTDVLADVQETPASSMEHAETSIVPNKADVIEIDDSFTSSMEHANTSIVPNKADVIEIDDSFASSMEHANTSIVPNKADVIEIDDSSNDSMEHQAPELDNKNVEPVKIAALTNLLLQDLGVATELGVEKEKPPTLPAKSGKDVVNLTSALLQDLGIVPTETPVIDITENDELDDIPTDSRQPNKNGEENVPALDEDNKIVKIQEKFNLKKCDVLLEKCDKLAETYKLMKKMKHCYVVMERLNDLILQTENEKKSDRETDEMNQDNAEDFINFDVDEPFSSPQLSRCPSLSILNNWGDDSQPALDRPYCTSPVMEIYDTLVQLRKKLETRLTRESNKTLSSTCDSEWTMTKLGYKSQEMLLASSKLLATENQLLLPVCDSLDSVQKARMTFETPKLLKIVLNFLDGNPNLLYRWEMMLKKESALKINPSSNTLKRKTDEIVGDIVASKVIKLGTLALNNLNSGIQTFIKSNNLKNMVIQLDNVENSDDLTIEAFAKHNTTTAEDIKLDKKTNEISNDMNVQSEGNNVGTRPEETIIVECEINCEKETQDRGNLIENTEMDFLTAHEKSDIVKEMSLEINMQGSIYNMSELKDVQNCVLCLPSDIDTFDKDSVGDNREVISPSLLNDYIEQSDIVQESLKINMQGRTNMPELKDLKNYVPCLPSDIDTVDKDFLADHREITSPSLLSDYIEIYEENNENTKNVVDQEAIKGNLSPLKGITSLDSDITGSASPAFTGSATEDEEKRMSIEVGCEQSVSEYPSESKEIKTSVCLPDVAVGNEKLPFLLLHNDINETSVEKKLISKSINNEKAAVDELSPLEEVEHLVPCQPCKVDFCDNNTLEDNQEITSPTPLSDNYEISKVERHLNINENIEETINGLQVKEVEYSAASSSETDSFDDDFGENKQQISSPPSVNDTDQTDDENNQTQNTIRNQEPSQLKEIGPYVTSPRETDGFDKTITYDHQEEMEHIKKLDQPAPSEMIENDNIEIQKRIHISDADTRDDLSELREAESSISYPMNTDFFGEELSEDSEDDMSPPPLSDNTDNDDEENQIILSSPQSKAMNNLPIKIDGYDEDVTGGIQAINTQLSDISAVNDDVSPLKEVENIHSRTTGETVSFDEDVTEDFQEVNSPLPLVEHTETEEKGRSINDSKEDLAFDTPHIEESDQFDEISIDELPDEYCEVVIIATDDHDDLDIVVATDQESIQITKEDALEIKNHDFEIKSPDFIDNEKITFNYHDYTKLPKKNYGINGNSMSSTACTVNNDGNGTVKSGPVSNFNIPSLKEQSNMDLYPEDIPTCGVDSIESYPLKSKPECKYEFIQEDDLLTVEIITENHKETNEIGTVCVGANDIEEDTVVASPCSIITDDINLKGYELEDVYVFPLSQAGSSNSTLSNDSLAQESSDSNSEIVIKCVPNDLHDTDYHVIEPKITYSRKRKMSMRDVKVTEKKYRKCKNIDCLKQTQFSITELAYSKEYKRLLKYCSSLKFSYSRPFHKECVELEDLTGNWPINSVCCDVPSDVADKHLFMDLEHVDNYQPDPVTQTFVEEISYDYNKTVAAPDDPQSEVSETNFNMGFGEGSGRVIQILKKEGESNISAATLSDVKQSQPVFKSVDPDHDEVTKNDQIKKLRQQVNFIELRDKVRQFFKKSAVELKYDWMQQNTKEVLQPEDFPFGLCSFDYVQPFSTNAIVHVVQVGQLPVSAAAQNPVTCDPRVTQVSNASPPQCSAENSPNDDSQSEIKTEYTELTTADLTLPLQEYAQQNQACLASQDSNVEITEQTISLEMEIKAEESPEIKQELPDIKEEKSNSSNADLDTLANEAPENIDYLYENNTPKTNDSCVNYESEQNSFDTFSQQRQQNGTTEKTDQIAHAMNAAGINTSPETISNTRAHALVNILSQKIRQGSVNTTQTTTNTYSKTSINAMALQQALAQILPPPLNQTGSSENNQTQSPSVGPQVLHIVQGKNSSGNQITLVDNSQQSVISTPNATQVLHIVQNKNATSGQASNGTLTPQSNSFSGLSLVEAGLQQGGNQLLHIVNTGNQKTANSGQLLKRVNLLTNLTNVQGSNEQKMVQFVCKSADGKAIQLNAPHQRSMVLRLQPIETPNVQTPPSKPSESQEHSPSPTRSAASKESASQQEIKSRSIYEENYAKFIQNSSSKTPGLEKSTSLPKFNQAFGKPVFQEGQKQGETPANNSHLPSVNTNSENAECPANDNAINIEHMGNIGSPPLLIRKPVVTTTQSQSNIVQQIKQTIAPMNIQTMHGGVIYTRQIPVNIGGGQTINLITVPSTELINDDSSKTQAQNNQGEIEPSIIKIVPQNQSTTNTESSQEESNNHASGSNENAQTSQPQPVLTQMRIKLPMLSKAPQMVPGARVVRPSFFQIQRNVIGGANQPVYQQLVLTAAPPLGQQTIRLPSQASRPVKVPSESQSSSSESQMSSSTLEQLREFDMVLEQVKERSTSTPSANSNSSSFKIHTSSSDTTDGNASSNCSTESTPQVLYSIGSNQSLNVTYVNRKTTVTTPTTSTYVRSPDSSGIADSPTSSTHVQIPHTVTMDSSPTEMSSQSKPAKVGSKSKSRPKSTSNPPNTLKLSTSVPPKTSSQKPLEDEQTTQRILYILAEYKEQVENSPDKDKPAPRRRSNPPSNPGSSKRKKSSSSRRSGTRDMSPIHGEDTCRTMGSEDSSCGTSQGDCNESCLDSHSPQDSPRKVARKITFDQDLTVTQPRPQPQRNLIVADGQTITVARGTTGKPATAVLMPANYILPMSMVKGGQQIAIVTNRGPKLLTVGGEGGATNALLLQRLIGPAGLKPMLARPGVRHVRLPTAALHNLQAFNLATATTVQPPDSTASPTTGPTPPELIDTRATSSPWTDRDEVKPERSSSPEGSEPWNLPSTDAHEYTYEETVRTDNMDRTVLVVQKKDGSQRQHRLVSAAALRHKYAILEHELRLQKSLSEECEDLGVDSPSASELFPEAELLFANSPAHEQAHEHHSHTPQPLQSSIPQPDMDDQIATDHLIPREIDVSLGLGDVGIVAVSEDGSATIALDQEEFARSHPNTTFHSEPTDGEVQPFTITGLKGRHITSTIFHSNSAPATVLMTAPQATVISQAPEHSVKYQIENMIHTMPSSHNNDINLSSVLVKDDGLTRFDNILTDSRELHLTNTTSAIVHSSGNATQVIRRVCYEDDKRERDARYLLDEPDNLIAGDDAKMVAEDSSRDATLESMVDDDRSSPERHAELFWESNSASERSESRRPLDFSSDSDKCCKSPSFDETNSTDSSGVGAHMRLDSVIKEARARDRSGSADGSSAEDTHPPLRTYPPKRLYHPLGEERSLSGKTRAGERSPDSLEVRRRASGRGVVKRGCHCCNGSPAPPRPKKPRQRKPTLDFTNN